MPERIKILETDRTIVETITLADAEFVVELLNTPDCLRFIGDRNLHSIEDGEQFLENGILRFYAENDFGYYLVRAKNGGPIGFCGFMKKPYLKNFDFGFALLPQFHGQGFGSEAAAAILEYVIEQFGLDEVDAVTDSDNVRSVALLKKLGFVPAGTVNCGETDEALLLFRHST